MSASVSGGGGWAEVVAILVAMAFADGDWVVYGRRTLEEIKWRENVEATKKILMPVANFLPFDARP